MIPITIALIVVQEMCARMGAVTGKGLSDLIREEFGLRMTFVVMILLVVVNFTNVITEFSGIAGSLGLFNLSKYISVPVCAVLVWLLVVKGDYKKVEKIFLIASVFYIAYIIAGVLSRPNWHTALVETIKLPPRSVWGNKPYVYMVVAVIGTTIAPWMQFYLQSSIVDKGVTVKQYKASRLDVIVGSIFTDVVAWFIIVACAATLYVNGIRDIPDASVAAQAMKPLAGDYAFILFAAGPLQRLALRGLHPSAVDRVHGLRRPRRRKRTRQDLLRSTVLLLVLHAAHRPRRGDRPHPELPHAEGRDPVAGPERRTAANRVDLHAQAHQQAGADGKVPQSTLVQRGGLVNGHHRHRPVSRHGLERPDRWLRVNLNRS